MANKEEYSAWLDEVWDGLDYFFVFHICLECLSVFSLLFVSSSVCLCVQAMPEAYCPLVEKYSNYSKNFCTYVFLFSFFSVVCSYIYLHNYNTHYMYVSTCSFMHIYTICFLFELCCHSDKNCYIL